MRVVMALIVTNAIKLGGLVIVFIEVSKPAPSAIFLALSAFMMAGAQISEDTVLNLVKGMFSPHVAGAANAGKTASETGAETGAKQ
jgi:hypothetical protein